MNLANVKTQLTTAVNTCITNGDLKSTKEGVAIIIAKLANELVAQESISQQEITDRAAHNKIVTSLGRPL